MTQSETPFWSDAWLRSQRAYLEALRTLPDRNAASVLDHWWRTVAPATEPSTQDFYAHLVELGGAYFRLVELLGVRFGDRGEDAGASSGPAGDWRAALDTALEAMSGAFAAPANDDPSRAAAGSLLGAWALPLDTWQRAAASLMGWRGDYVREVQATAADPHARLREALSAPTLGYTRENQAQLQRLAKLALEHEKAQREYTALFSQTGVEAVARLRQSLAGMAEKNASIGSTRELYDLWVDCCEDVYADTVSTTQYAELYGRLVNSLIALKGQSRSVLEEVVAPLDLPGRNELETLQQHLAQSRRELRRCRADLASLDARVSALEAGLVPATPRPGRASRTAPKPTSRRTRRRVTRATDTNKP